MAQEFNFTADITGPSIEVDLSPGFYGMPKSVAEVEVFRGDEATLKFIVTKDGSAFNLTGYSVLYQAKVAIGDSSFVFNKTGTITDATKGKCQVALSGADLGTARTLQSQLYLTQTGTTQTVLQFPLVIVGSV